MSNSPVHGWFGLTYSGYLVLHRSVMEAMPVEWQERMVALLNEMEDRVQTELLPQTFMVKATAGGRFISDPFSNYRRPPPITMRTEEESRARMNARKDYENG